MFVFISIIITLPLLEQHIVITTEVGTVVRPILHYD